MHWAEIVNKDGKELLPIKDETVECHIPISIGRPYYENQQVLQDIINAVKKIFPKCKVLVHIADTLQAPSFRLTIPKEIEEVAKKIIQRTNKNWDTLKPEERNDILNNAANELARQKGTKWENDNKTILEEIKPKIDHWNSWTEKAEFKEYLKIINNCYQNKEDFTNSVNIAAFNFMGVLNNELKKGKIPPMDPVIAAKTNIDYIKQETAVVKMWQCNSETSASSRFIVIYPSNTPAHQCMVDCMNTLDTGELTKNKKLPKMEFFDINFYCSANDNPLPNTNIYQAASKKAIRKRNSLLQKSTQIELNPVQTVKSFSQKTTKEPLLNNSQSEQNPIKLFNHSIKKEKIIPIKDLKEGYDQSVVKRFAKVYDRTLRLFDRKILPTIVNIVNEINSQLLNVSR